jgi:hypothetical protein
VGASQSAYSGYGIQQRYDIAYAQCMAAHGNQVPTQQAAYAPAPGPYAAYPYPYPYGYYPGYYGPPYGVVVGFGGGWGWGWHHHHW